MTKYDVRGMSCAACQARVEKAVNKVEGVTECSVSLLTNSMIVEGDAAPDKIIAAVVKAGYDANLYCKKGTGSTGNLGNTGNSDGNGDTGGQDGNRGGYNEMTNDDFSSGEERVLMKRLIASLIFLLPLMYIGMGHMMWGWPLPQALSNNHIAMGLIELLLTTAVMVINQKFFISGTNSLLHGAPNMDTLVAMGSGAAYVYSVYALFRMSAAKIDGISTMQYMDELYFESAAMILTLITVGKLLEARSKGKTTDALKSLMRLSAKTATVIKNGIENEIAIENVKKGDIFVVRPGENIPVDGIVIEGNSAVNEAALTGESIPIDKTVGDEVKAATTNMSGFMKCEAIRVGEDTTLSKIIQMVSDAAATKAPIAKIADAVSGVFVPTVIAIAIVTIIVWLCVGAEFGFALARGISVLVISCPCALGLATPVAIMVGNGVAAKNGILFKTAVSLEQTGKMTIVALDKTGTITEGRPKTTDVICAEGVSESELVSFARAIEAKSEHPLSKAVMEYAEKFEAELTRKMKKTSIDGVTNYDQSENGQSENDQSENGQSENILRDIEISEFVALPGNGLRALICDENDCGRRLIAGNLRFLNEEKINIPLEMINKAEELSKEGKTPMFFAVEERFLGIIAVADTIKDDSERAIAELKGMGIHVVMITGDNEVSARAIGEKAGVDEIIAGVLPEGKEAAIRKLKERGKVIMVGDGINDAPALTSADIGIAIGAGTDIAIDAAEVVLMKSSLLDVPAALRLSHRTIRNIKENLFWAFIYNVIGIPLAAGVYIPLFGWTLNPMFGALAMSLSSFSVVTNALRLNTIKVYDRSRDAAYKNQIEKITKKNTKKAERNENQIEEMQRTEEQRTDNHSRENKRNSGKGNNNNNMKGNIKNMEKTISIEGMMCGHCEASVKKALLALDGVTDAVVSKDSKTAVVKLAAEVDDATLKAAVEAKDFTVTGISQ